MNSTNTAYCMRRCRKALAAATLLFTAPLLAQWGPPGELDPSFNGGSVLMTNFFDTGEEINAVAALPDGRFVVAGSVVGRNVSGTGSSPNFAVARYLPDGRIDPSFGTNGLFQLDLSGNVDEAHAVKRLSDGSLLVTGMLAPTPYTDFALVKLRRDGSLDTAFGDDNGVGARSGYTRLDVRGPSIHDEGHYVAVQSDGRIIVAGNSLVPVGNFQYRRVTVARYTADGRLDTSFGGNNTGYTVLPATYTDAQSSDYVSGIATTQSGALPANDSITLVGYTFARNNGFVLRLTRDGLLDTGFNGSGKVALSSASTSGVYRGASELRGGVIDETGRTVLLGTGGDNGFTFLRLLPNGSQDMSFGTNGRTLMKYSVSTSYDEPRAIALQGNGKIVASGTAISVATGAPRKDFFVTRLQADGKADFGFGDGQGRKVVAAVAEADGANAVTVEPSGKILAAGFALRPGTSQNDFAVLRVFGDPDRIFADSYEQPVF